MGELTIRRNRGFSVPRYQGIEKAEKQAGSSQSQKTARTTGLNVSETLRQLMSRGNQVESRSRESHRTLQTGEVVLAEVQERLGRMAELAGKAAQGGKTDRAALQAELELLRGDMDRIIKSANVGGVSLFLDEETGAEEELDALLYAFMSEASAGQEAPLPDWLMKGIAQSGLDSGQILFALGLDQTASGEEILAAIAKRPLEDSPVTGYLASLYLGAVIAGGGTAGKVDASQARDGLRQFLEMVSKGVSPDEAIETLTDGRFTSLADFQEQFTAGMAPGMQEFLVDLLLSDGASLLDGVSLLNFLGGLEGMELELMMGLLDGLQSSGGAAELNAAPAEMAGAMDTGAAAPETVSALQAGNIQVTGQDLSGVSFDEAAGVLTVGGTADVVIRGAGEQTVVVTGSGTVTLQDVRVPVLTVTAGEARIFSAGETVLGELQLKEGTSLTLGGEGLLQTGALRADGSNALRMTGGAVVLVGKNGETLGTLTVPVVLDGPVSLAARAVHVSDLEGRALEPFDIVWKTLLPGFSAVTEMTLDGRQMKMALMSGGISTLMRLWMDKGDPSHGYPHSLFVRGRDEFGRPKARYAYLLWSQQAGTFEEISMYPNPFTITGGEESRDWVYEEETHTLHILSGQVTAIAGGVGTDAHQALFSGRIALADGIGEMELTLGGVVCRVSSGRAFHLGRENNVTLLLQSGSSNLFESGAGFAGISLGEGTSLCIDCPDARDDRRDPAGTLTATGGSGGAGIGRDSGGGRDRTSHIQIRGGIITAAGTGGGAGIGAGKRGFMGPVTIVGGIITSTGGAGGGAGIGGALGAPVGDISIRGGTVTASAVHHAAAIGAGVQGASGDILISGTARIEKAVGGDPGADIGACLLGGCGKVRIAGGADIGSARLWTRPGVSLQMGEDIVMLPQFRLSTRALRLRRLSLKNREDALAAEAMLDADRRWVSRIQGVYSALYSRLEQSAGGPDSGNPYIDEGLVRDTVTASTLLKDMRQSIPLPASRAMDTHSRRGVEDVEQLLR